MIIRTIITILLAIPAFCLTLRYNMHMFQLNGYKNGEHVNWLKKNIRMQWVLIYGIILGIVRLVLPYTAVDVLMYLSLLLIIVVYRAMKRMTTKKKLVYTPRVKRMITTNVLVTFIIIVLTVVLGGGSFTDRIRPLDGVLMLLVSVQFFMNIVCNIINHPVEAAINRYYINDLKEKA